MKGVTNVLPLQAHNNCYSEEQPVNGTMPERKCFSVCKCVCVRRNFGKPTSVRAADTETPPPGPPASVWLWDILNRLSPQKLGIDLVLFLFSWLDFFMILCGFMMEN